MREIAEMFVPKSMYSVLPVRMLPPTRMATGLAGWGITAGFGLCWMIGDDSFAYFKSLVVAAPDGCGAEKVRLACLAVAAK